MLLGRLHLCSPWKIFCSALFSIPVNKIARYTSQQGHGEDKTSMRVRWVIDRADDRTSKLWAKLFHCHHQNKCQSQVSSNFHPLRDRKEGGLSKEVIRHLFHWTLTPCFQPWLWNNLAFSRKQMTVNRFNEGEVKRKEKKNIWTTVNHMGVNASFNSLLAWHFW